MTEQGTTWLKPLLGRYSEALLRRVAGQFLKLRTKPSAEELKQKLLAGYDNVVLIDRRLRELSPEAATLLSILRLGNRHTWKPATLLELTSSLSPVGSPMPDGMATLFELLEAGLLLPSLPETNGKLSTFESILPQAMSGSLTLLTIPAVLQRATSLGGSLPALVPVKVEISGSPHLSDGLGWFIRLGYLWQQIRQSPCKLTQQMDFFKRDAERLGQEPLLTSLNDELPLPIPDAGFLLMSLALSSGLFSIQDSMICAIQSPLECWGGNWLELVRQYFAAIVELASWTPMQGWKGLNAVSSPESSAGLLAIAALSRTGNAWVSLDQLAGWVASHHPYWRVHETKNLLPWVNSYISGILFPLGLVETVKLTSDSSAHAVRFSQLGRAIFLGESPPALPEFPKTMFVQPNMQLLVYRQGLTPRLIAELSRFADWNQIGPACTLSMDATSIYRGLESGCTGDSILALIQSHSVKEIPANVVDAIRTWSAKRDRLSVYSAACLVEFQRPEELDAALSRGMAGQRLSDRIFLVENEDALDLKQFRLGGTRDYSLPAGMCVELASDGVTLHVDAVKADLLLETEIRRFAERVENNGQKWVYQATPNSISQARQLGLSLKYLEEWFSARTGQSVSPAIRMLWKGEDCPSSRLQSLIVLEAGDQELADGIWQWPETRGLLATRLGPTHFAVHPEQLKALQTKLNEIRLLSQSSLSFTEPSN